MKNVEELYGKYYNAYKSDYDSEDELNEAKKKTFNYKQFELVDKTDKEFKLDEETKKFIEEIKEQEEGVGKRGFSRYFNSEPSTLVSKSLSQNTQAWKKVWTKLNNKRLN